MWRADSRGQLENSFAEIAAFEQPDENLGCQGDAARPTSQDYAAVTCDEGFSSVYGLRVPPRTGLNYEFIENIMFNVICDHVLYPGP